MILEHVSGFTYAQQLVSDLKVLPVDWLQRMDSILDDRKKHRPLQYCLGETFFCGLRFATGEGVLIPRNDTETLVQVVSERVISHFDSAGIQLQCAEIGVGAGVIAVSLLKRLPGAHFWACDTNVKAVCLSRQNAIYHNVQDRLQLVCGDWKTELPSGLKVIVSNPPYIPKSAQSKLAPEIRAYEPEQALFVEADDGLSFYRDFASQLPKHFAPGVGLIALECGDHQCLSVKNILQEQGFRNVEVYRDTNNLSRVVAGELFS